MLGDGWFTLSVYHLNKIEIYDYINWLSMFYSL